MERDKRSFGCRPSRLGVVTAVLLSLLSGTGGLQAAGPVPLTDGELDAVAAGSALASGWAGAQALGPDARTHSDSGARLARQEAPVLRVRRMAGRDVAIADPRRSTIEIGLATARASAAGQAPSVRCATELALSARPSFAMAATRERASMNRAGCACTQFGIAVIRR